LGELWLLNVQVKVYISDSGSVLRVRSSKYIIVGRRDHCASWDRREKGSEKAAGAKAIYRGAKQDQGNTITKSAKIVQKVRKEVIV
jgi:hypothetical protein